MAPIVANDPLVYLSWPVAFLTCLEAMLHHDVFPPESDSLLIPVLGFAALFVLAVPLYALFVGLSLWRHPGSVPPLSWDPSRPWRSSFWTLLFAVLAAVALVFALSDVPETGWLYTLHGLMVVYLLLILRASVLMRRVNGQ